MGRPSNRKKSARRLGRRERERVKNHKPSVFIIAGGAGIVAEAKAGRKKFHKVDRYINDVVDLWIESQLTGEPLIQKSEKVIRRPLYKITFT